MFHSMFYYGVNGSAPTTVGFRWGDYTVNGSFTRRIDTGTEFNYLFDSTAQTSLSSSDFVFIMCNTSTDNLDAPPLANSSNVRFDCQGDSGSGSILTSGTSTTTAKNVVWTTQSGNSGGGQDLNRDDDMGGSSIGLPLCIPASLFGTSDSTRTGRIFATSSASTDIMVDFIFCSWSSNTTSQYRPGNFTVNGGYYEAFGGVQDNYLFSSGLRTAFSTSDYLMVTWCATSNNATTVGYFDTQGDGGSGSLLTAGTGTGTNKNVIWRTGPHAPLYLPAGLISSSDTTRTGRRLGNANSSLVSMIACTWNS